MKKEINGILEYVTNGNNPYYKIRSEEYDKGFWRLRHILKLFEDIEFKDLENKKIKLTIEIED
ncbi:MAG: hypothetical protein ACFFG0_08045 [Candidatus Thorarchaeota archaeon]